MRSSPSKADTLQPSWLGFAHRGLHSPGMPENSLAAFRAAAVFSSGTECDVRLSRDGVPMVFHDADLQRLSGTNARVESSDSGWLAGQLLLGTDETIPTLADLLGKWPAHLPLLIECKTMGDNSSHLAQAVAAALLLSSRTAGIMSFDLSISRWLAAHRPQFPRGLVVNADWPADWRSEAVDQAQPQFLAVDIRLLDDPWTAAMRAKMPVYTWTVRTRDDRRRALPCADALIWEADGRP